MLKSSIIIANYNKGDLFCNAIQSALDQKISDVILIDDASTDSSESWMMARCKKKPPKDEWAQVEKNIHVLFLSKNHGRSAARNQGIKYAVEILKSEVVGFLDSDDEYLPGKMERSIAKIEEDPNAIGLVYSDFVKYDSSGLVTEEYRQPFDLMSLQRDCIIASNAVVSSQAIMYAGGFDVNMAVAEDWDLWLKICHRYVGVHIPEILVKMNVSENNATVSVPGMVWQQNWGLIHQRLQSGYYRGGQ